MIFNKLFRNGIASDYYGITVDDSSQLDIIESIKFYTGQLFTQEVKRALKDIKSKFAIKRISLFSNGKFIIDGHPLQRHDIIKLLNDYGSPLFEDLVALLEDLDKAKALGLYVDYVTA